ncbi:AI-2E family transporter [Thermodesulfobacteriota bacterium]
MNRPKAPLLFYGILSIFLIFFGWLCWAFLPAIVLGLLIASAFYPLYIWYKKLYKGKETFKALSMTIIVLLVIIIPVWGFVGSLYKEAADLYGRTKDRVTDPKTQELLESDSVWAERIRKLHDSVLAEKIRAFSELTNIEINTESIQDSITSTIKDVGFFLTKQVRAIIQAIVTNLLSFLLHFLLMILIIYHIFKDGEQLKNYLLSLLPFPESQQELILAKFHEMGRAIIIGNGLSGIIQGVLGGFAFYLFDLGSPLIWGTVMGFLAFLPVIGASVVFIPATIVLLLQGKTGASLVYFIYNASYSALIEYLIKPKLIGQGMRMNTIFVFIGILGGLKLWGILGIVYGPFILTIIFTLFEIYRLEYSTTINKRWKKPVRIIHNYRRRRK